MPELELDSGKDADKNMSGEEDIVVNDDGMEEAL